MTIDKTTMVAIALSAMVAACAFATTAEAGGKVKLSPVVINSPVLNIPSEDPYDPSDPFGIFDPQPQPKPKPIYFPLPIDFGKKGQNEAHEMALDCKVADAGDDLWLVNFGSDEIPAGTKVRFSVPSTGDHGAFLVPRGIEAGKTIKISDLLHGAENGAPCRVQILQ